MFLIITHNGSMPPTPTTLFHTQASNWPPSFNLTYHCNFMVLIYIFLLLLLSSFLLYNPRFTKSIIIKSLSTLHLPLHAMIGCKLGIILLSLFRIPKAKVSIEINTIVFVPIIWFCLTSHVN